MIERHAFARKSDHAARDLDGLHGFAGCGEDFERGAGFFGFVWEQRLLQEQASAQTRQRAGLLSAIQILGSDFKDFFENFFIDFSRKVSDRSHENAGRFFRDGAKKRSMRRGIERNIQHDDGQASQGRVIYRCVFRSDGRTGHFEYAGQIDKACFLEFRLITLQQFREVRAGLAGFRQRRRVHTGEPQVLNVARECFCEAG